MTRPPPEDPHAVIIDAAVSVAIAAALSRRGRTAASRRACDVAAVSGSARETPARKPYCQTRVICNTMATRVAHRYAIANVRKLAADNGVSASGTHARGRRRGAA